MRHPACADEYRTPCFAKASDNRKSTEGRRTIAISTPNITWFLSFESWFLSLVSWSQVYRRDASHRYYNPFTIYFLLIYKVFFFTDIFCFSFQICCCIICSKLWYNKKLQGILNDPNPRRILSSEPPLSGNPCLSHRCYFSGRLRRSCHRLWKMHGLRNLYTQLRCVQKSRISKFDGITG